MQASEPGLICQGCYVLWRPYRTVQKEGKRVCPDCGTEAFPELKGKDDRLYMEDGYSSTRKHPVK